MEAADGPLEIGRYAEVAYGVTNTDSAEIVPSIRRGTEQTKKGVPALLQFITAKETTISKQYHGSR